MPLAYPNPRKQYTDDAGLVLPAAPDFNSGAISDTINLGVITPSEVYQTNRELTPHRDTSIKDRLEQGRDYQANLEAQTPKNKHWYERLLPVLLGAGAGGRAGGWGALGGSLVGGLQSLINPDYYAQQKRDRELAKVKGEIGDETKLREQESVSNYRNAQAEKLLSDAAQPPKRHLTTVGPGGAIFDDDGKLVVERPAKPEKEVGLGTATRILNKEQYGLPAGTKIHLKSDGTDFVDANGEALIVDLAPADKVSKDAPDYATRAQWYRKKEGESRADAARLRAEADKIVAKPAGMAGAYYPINDSEKARKADLLSRAAQLDNDARSYRDKGDEAETMPKPRAQSSGTVKPAKDGKYHYTLDQVRAAVPEGQTFEEVLQKLKARSNVIIDQ